MVAKFNSYFLDIFTKYVYRFFEPFRLRLTSNFAKSANLNVIWVLKNAEFDADFESIEKVAKRPKGKPLSAKRDRKWSDFYYCVQKFSAYNSFWVIFFHFFSMIRFCVL
jgi:hypothetical protein